MKNWKVILPSNTFFLFLFLFILCYTIIYFIFPKRSVYSFNDKEVIGIVTDYKLYGDTLSLTLKGKEKLKVFYKIKTKSEKEWLDENILYGIEIKASGVLDEALENVIPNTFNYKKYLYYEHIFFILKADELEFVNEPMVWYKIKNAIVKYIKKYKCHEYLKAFILGDTSNFDMTNLRANGISHLFAVSGMHFSFFLLFLSKFLKKSKVSHQILLNLILFFYAFLVSFSPSILRVYFIYCLDKINKNIGNVFNRRQIIFLAFFFLLLIDPFYLKNKAFQYTFLICFAFSYIKEENNYFKNLFKMSVISFLVSLPITAMNFYEVNFLSVFLNMFFVPYVSLILYPCCFLVLVCPFCVDIYQFLIGIFEYLNDFFSVISFGHIIVPKVSIFIWIIYEIILWGFLIHGRKRWLVYLFLIGMMVLYLPRISNKSFVYFLDVLQGDAAIFISPHQKEIFLIDTGGTIKYRKESWQEKIGATTTADTLVTFLHSLGIGKINTLVLTHGDADHLGNAIKILEGISVDFIVLNHNELNAAEENIVKKYPSKIKDNLESNFFGIEEYSFSKKNDENYSSLIYRITVGNYNFLMMGDAPKEVENKILNESISSDVIKIGHHGSKTSSGYAFLKKVNPSYAIISVAEENRYNHPSKETIETLEKLKISYYETSKYHTMLFKIDDDEMNFVTFLFNS